MHADCVRERSLILAERSLHALAGVSAERSGPGGGGGEGGR